MHKKNGIMDKKERKHKGKAQIKTKTNTNTELKTWLLCSIGSIKQHITANQINKADTRQEELRRVNKGKQMSAWMNHRMINEET